jgi:hypothetical protein
MMKTVLAKLDFTLAQPLTGLANAGLVRLLIKCPAVAANFQGAWLKVEGTVFGATGAGSCLIEVFETPTLVTDGVAATPQNRSRIDTPPVCPVPVFVNSDIAVGGTALDRGYAAVSQEWCSEHWLMKPGVNYFVRLTNQSGAALTDGALKLNLGIVPVNITDYLRIFGG